MNARYRYTLSRETGLLHGRGEGLFVMLNPSTADEQTNDPTIRRCIAFASAFGWAALHVVNLFAMRATDPYALLDAADPVGPENDRSLADALGRFPEPVAAWGAVHTRLRPRVRHVLASHPNIAWRCLGVTLTGQPRHPLFVPAARELEAWNQARWTDRP